MCTRETLPFDITYIAIQGSCGIIFLLMIKRETSLSRRLKPTKIGIMTSKMFAYVLTFSEINYWNQPTLINESHPQNCGKS